MRVISGKAKGMKLAMAENLITRPTADRVKESLFNMLGPGIADASVLDIFSGVGNIGLEALSRAAKRVVFIDSNHASISAIKKNLKHTKLDNGYVEIIEADYQIALKRIKGTFDFIFADPPYALRVMDRVEEIIVERQLLAEKGLLVVEHDRPLPMKVLQLVRTKKYGQTKLSFFRYQTASQEE